MLQVEWIGRSTLTELVLLALAFFLSALVGFERHRQLKSAGLRTHTLVGLGAAVFTLVSGYGFQAIVGTDVVLDPSRIAAQIVSGIGFLGAGVIFVRQDVVTGLTTAASIWVTAAIGMAAGAGMPILAGAGTALYFVAVILLSRLGRRVRQRYAGAEETVHIRYREGRGALRAVLLALREAGCESILVSSNRIESETRPAKVDVRVNVRKQGGLPDELIDLVTSIAGVQSASIVGQPRD